MISIKILLSILTIIVSCNSYRQPKESLLLTGNNLSDTVKPVITTSFKATAYPDIFEAAFSNETKVQEGDIKYSFYMLDIGKIKIKSGKLIACDPIVMQDIMPFVQNFPKGEFPVHLAMANTINDERVAFSRIVFSDKSIAKWEFALQKGQKPIPLNDTSFYCYGVDAGTGIFIDSIANNIFSKKDHSEWENIFIAKAEKNGYKGFIHDFDGHNLATFSTGYGDGCYATYIGLDRQGNVVQILTDFGLVGWWKIEEKKQIF
ncbi:DUF4241 domain-containing protein [Lacibacter sp.]|uniref:DUF4241 domain-containing protein n=1 Tax=Lacibacter sp. TaxID=1915409 RepID=UPI002B4B6E76|nr:DUF4241 domain-containing protein [Lacibacter sp.]HLP35989.1 DUF4241 domain-containing protein [Lacibacter sp.]